MGTKKEMIWSRVAPEMLAARRESMEWKESREKASLLFSFLRQASRRMESAT
jgi:hypothetical protein